MNDLKNGNSIFSVLSFSKQLIATKWERSFFFTVGGNLMSQTRGEVKLGGQNSVASPVNNQGGVKLGGQNSVASPVNNRGGVKLGGSELSSQSC